MALDRVRVVSSAFPGEPGYTNFYFNGTAAANITALTAFINAWKPYMPAGMKYTIPNSGDSIAESSGNLVGGWTAGAASTITSTGSGVYAAPAGALFQWKASTVVDGHRPVGRTFFVPFTSLNMQNNGTIDDAAVTVLTAAATTLISATSGFTIWHRPKYDRTGPVPVLIRAGSAVPVTSGLLSDKVCVLRSRRP